MKLFYLLFLLSFNAAAHSFHHHDTPEPEVTTIVNEYTSTKGIALAIAASQHHFDFGTHEWQGSVGAGSFKDENAVSFGMGKRYGRMLINVSCGSEGGDIGCGAGLNWRF